MSRVNRDKKLPKKNPKIINEKTEFEDSVVEKRIPEEDNEENKDADKILLEQSKYERSHKILIEKVFFGDFGVVKEKNPSTLQEKAWEYVIVFKNPDFPGLENEEIQDSFAQNFYRTCFRPRKSGNIHKDRLRFLSESESFLTVFKSLNTFGEGKALNGGSRLKINEKNIVDNGTKIKDFSSLVRNCVFYKLVGNIGLKVRQLVSASGEYIYFLITADEEDLKYEAERTRFSKQLEISLSDLQSLTPCDAVFRPFDILINNDEEIKKINKEIKPFLKKAFKLEKNLGKVNYKYEAVGVTERMWSTYKVYLNFLREGIKKIETSNATHTNQMFLFQKLIKDSLEKANQTVSAKEDRLSNLWTCLGFNKPIAPYAEYRESAKNDELNGLWRKHQIDKEGTRSLFKNMERIRLIYSLIESEIKINALEEEEFVVAHFPLHNSWQLNGSETLIVPHVSLEDRLLRNILYDFKPLDQDGPLKQAWRTSLINQRLPLSKIKNYFGEKLGLYFEFLRFQQVSLLIPGIIGLAVYIIQQLFDQDSPQTLVLNTFYSIFMTIWATVYLEAWSRRESTLAVVWGQTNFEKVEIPRPQYKGVPRRSPITDDMDEIYYESSKRIKFFILACSVTLFIICCVLGIVAGLLILKQKLNNDLIYFGTDFAPILCSVLNAIQIQIFNFIYRKLSKTLTDLENHKTQEQYNDSLVLKIFAFQFVNSYNSLAYIAFVKTYSEGCLVTNAKGSKELQTGASCMDELYTQLISIFIVGYLRNLIEIGIPYGKYCLKRKRDAKSRVLTMELVNDIRIKIEEQIDLDYYLTNQDDETIDDYMELAVQFGYLTLFALAFPLSSILAFVGLWLEMFTDKIKLINLVRRPIPFAANDIGSWWNIFSAICVIAIFSNTALFCFTANTFKNWDAVKDYNYVIFAVIVIILLIFRSQLQTWIPDVPEKIEILQARHEFIVEKLLRGNEKTEAPQDDEAFDGTMYFTTTGEKHIDIS